MAPIDDHFTSPWSVNTVSLRYPQTGFKEGTWPDIAPSHILSCLTGRDAVTVP